MRLRSISLMTLAAMAGLALAQPSWQPTRVDPWEYETTVLTRLSNYATYQTNPLDIWNSLQNAPMEDREAPSQGELMEIPLPNGGRAQIEVWESPILAPNVAAQYPGVTTYSAQGVSDRRIVGRLDYTTSGFHAMLITPEGTVLVDPVVRGNKTTYVSYFAHDEIFPGGFTCYTDPGALRSAVGSFAVEPLSPGTAVQLKTYRLAINTTGEYTTYHGGAAGALAAATTSLNRAVGIMINDLAMAYTVVYFNAFTNSATDPFTNSNPGAMLAENIVECSTAVGATNYDLGHVLTTAGGGVAYIGALGNNFIISGGEIKGGGNSGHPVPMTDWYDVAILAHEMGHMMGANHTFNSTSNGCNGNRNASSAYEPGAGTTIMSYSGLCSPEDIINSWGEAYYHVHSILEMLTVKADAWRGGTTTAVANNLPTIDAGLDFTVPQSTPFILTATSNDPDLDPLTFAWEQYDLGTASPTADLSTKPLFRSRAPGASSTRFMPPLADVLAGVNPTWEFLPNVNRTLTFRAGARDNKVVGGGYAQDLRVVTVSGAPMTVNFPSAAGVSIAQNGNTTVTWSVGGSAAASPNVNIRLSYDGGNSYGTGGSTLLLANTPNDGSQVVTIPAGTSTTARIFVESSAGTFYDVSNNNFTIGSNNAAFVSQSIPAAMTAGQTYPVTVTMQNNGTLNWTAAKNYRLYAWNPNGNTTWIPAGGILLAGGDNIAPGQNKTFTFNVVAPEAAGTYNMQFRMTQYGTNIFGTASTNVPVNVTVAPNAARFISQITPPTTVAAGSSHSVQVVMRNVGSNAWTEATLYRLFSMNPALNLNWGLNRWKIPGPTTVNPGSNHTFTATVTAPWAAGTYNWQWRMGKDGVGYFGDLPTNVPITVTAVGNAATWVSQTVPATVNAGATFATSFTMKNTGTNTWTAATGYKLFSQNPALNTTWGLNRILIGGAASVAPNTNYTFNQNLTAPWAPGTYNLQFRVGKEGTGYFGDTTVNVPVVVNIIPNAATYVSQSVPTTVAAGATFSASITMKNTGSATWSAADNFKMFSQNPTNNLTWGANRILIPGATTVPTNTNHTFTSTFTAPLTPGTYNFQWRMGKEAVGYFGQLSPNVVITVT